MPSRRSSTRHSAIPVAQSSHPIPLAPTNPSHEKRSSGSSHRRFPSDVVAHFSSVNSIYSTTCPPGRMIQVTICYCALEPNAPHIVSCSRWMKHRQWCAELRKDFLYNLPDRVKVEKGLELIEPEDPEVEYRRHLKNYKKAKRAETPRPRDMVYNTREELLAQKHVPYEIHKNKENVKDIKDWKKKQPKASSNTQSDDSKRRASTAPGPSSSITPIDTTSKRKTKSSARASIFPTSGFALIHTRGVVSQIRRAAFKVQDMVTFDMDQFVTDKAELAEIAANMVSEELIPQTDAGKSQQKNRK